MPEPVCPDVVVCVCCNCIPKDDGRLPRQWDHEGAHVVVREVPCSGKIDGQYLLHAFEGGGRGICVATCPQGECRLAQGNYRAEIRVGTAKKLLGEIGLEPKRVEIVRCSPDAPFAQYEQAIRDAVGRICALGESPVGASTQ